MIGHLALLTLLTTQDLTKPVTYRTVAVPIHRALEEISKQSGLRLFAEPALDSEPIILSLQSASTQDVMKRIAETVGAEWEKRDKTEFLLRRTGEIEEKLAKEALDVKTSRVQRALGRIVSPKPLTDAELKSYASASAKSLAGLVKLYKEQRLNSDTTDGVVGQLPAQRALHRLLKILPARQIAALEENQSFALSNHPNRMQVALPSGSEEIGNQFQVEQNAVAQAFEDQHIGKLTLFDGRLASSVRALDEPPAKMLVIVKRVEGAPYVRLVLIDDAGRAQGYSMELLTVDRPRSYQQRREATQAASTKEKEIPLSAQSLLVSQAFNLGVTKIGDQPPLKPETRDLLLNPSEHDPLSFLVSDAFLAWADEGKANLVVYPSDSWFTPNGVKADEASLKLPRWIQIMDEAGAQVKEADGWLTVSPEDRLEAWRQRTDRELFGRCLREAEEKGYVSVETAAALADSDRTLQEPPLTMDIALIQRKYSPYIYREKRLLRFYASLSPSQIDHLVKGGAIRAGSLDKDQWTRFEDVAFRSSPRVSFKSDRPAADNSEGRYVLDNEPTELMPDGVPDDATVTMKWLDQNLLFAGLRSSVMTFARPTTIDYLAACIAKRQSDPAADVEEVLWISPGHVRVATLSFNLVPGHRREGQLTELVQGTERWPMDSLPSEIKAKLDAAVVQARKALDKPDTEQAPAPPGKPPR